MPIPSKSDLRWKRVVEHPESYRVTGLATCLLMSRLRFLAEAKQTKPEEAINIAYDFFVKNEKIVPQDLKLLFG